MALTKEAIANLEDLTIEEIHVPEWKDSVFLKGLTGTQRGIFEVDNAKSGGKLKIDFREAFLAKTMCDKEGNLLFDSVKEGIKILGPRAGAPISRLFDRAWTLSGLDEDDRDELEKN